MSDWDPDLYRRFAAERAQPFHDLLALIRPIVGGRLVDLGCGDGELTNEAARQLGAADIVGIDSSPAMLERAVAHEGDGVRFERSDIGPWTSAGDFDVVLANASLQWVPDHDDVLARWSDALAPGGQLAVQVPANGDHPSHLVADEVAQLEPFSSAIASELLPDGSSEHVLRPEKYATLLHGLGFAEQHVRLQVYTHVLGRSADVVDWVRGTTLTRYFRALPDDLHETFVDAYRTTLLERIGEDEPYVYAFKRILMWARRPKPTS